MKIQTFAQTVLKTFSPKSCFMSCACDQLWLKNKVKLELTTVSQNHGQVLLFTPRRQTFLTKSWFSNLGSCSILEFHRCSLKDPADDIVISESDNNPHNCTENK